jgi:hypothetical protein
MAFFSGFHSDGGHSRGLFLKFAENGRFMGISGGHGRVSKMAEWAKVRV